jgi:hypothetical protein
VDLVLVLRSLRQATASKPDCSTDARNGVFNMRQIRRGGDLWGANLIPWLQGPRAAVAPATPRAGTFARTG